MDKGEITHQAIIERAAVVFNKQGYAGTSMGDLTAATGLSKGAIYNHFKNKDDLAVQVFSYSMKIIQELTSEALRNAPRHAIYRLQAVIAIYYNYIENAAFAGGCPMLNTAVEADDNHPLLRDYARKAMNVWRKFVITTIQRGIQEGQVRDTVDVEATADIIISTLEGGIMMSKLYGNSDNINRVIEFLTEYIETTLKP